MISDFTITDLRQAATGHTALAARYHDVGYTQSAALRDTMAAEYGQLADIAELLNADARLRDALGEARDRRDNPPTKPVHRAVSGITGETGFMMCGSRSPDHIYRDEGVTCPECLRMIGKTIVEFGSPCAECGELTLVLVDGRPLCEPCFDVANAVNLVPADEPDLAPSDAQDDEAGEVEIS